MDLRNLRALGCAVAIAMVSVPLADARAEILAPSLSYQAYTNYVYFDGVAISISDGTLDPTSSLTGPVGETAGGSFTTTTDGNTVVFSAESVADFTSIGASGSIDITNASPATVLTVASAEVIDFYTPTGGVGTVDMIFNFNVTGTITGNLSNATLIAGAVVDTTPDGLSDILDGTPDLNLLESPVAGANALSLSTAPVTVAYGDTIELSFAISVGTIALSGSPEEGSVDADFASTIVLESITLSEDATITTASGVQVQTIVEIPTPAALPAGLAILAIIGARRRRFR